VEPEPRLLGLFHQFLPPDLSVKYLAALALPVLQTVEIAAGGLLVAIILGMAIAIWIAARLPAAHVLYGVLASFRSIPDLTLAIFCVVIVGIGPAAGLIALASFYTAAMGKVFADLLLAADTRPLEALRSTGAGEVLVALFGRLPLQLNEIASFGFYEFECAVRASVVIGAVGGGGLGTEILGTLTALDYRRTTTLMIVLLLLIMGVDRLALWFRHRPAAIVLLIPVGVIGLWQDRPALVYFSHTFNVLKTMLPPRLPAEALTRIPRLVAETAGMAIGGTVLAALAGVALGLLATRSVFPKLAVGLTRRFLEGLRAVPAVIWGLLLVSTLGWIGPLAGMVALTLHSAGSLGRLFGESFENVPTRPVDAIVATGASPLAVSLFARLPLALPPLAIHALFRLEGNIRVASIVGVIGAGGIGEALFHAQQLFFYREMLAYIGITWGLVLLFDWASAAVRRRMRLLAPGR
jgi:phosphonate transport system permease protein